MKQNPEISVVVVSFNTRELLRECLTRLERASSGAHCEVIVVDNASRDGSADMVETEFPAVVLVRSTENLGFAAANNRGFAVARGRYIVLLNSDAFLGPDALSRAIRHMEQEPSAGLGGARLVGRDGSWQPSARMFPSVVNEFLVLTGLAARFPGSRWFGRFDRTWADPGSAAEVDWVPGAFSIIRREVLDQVGWFDERFFLYYEEVDLCRRIKAAGHRVFYWPDIVVTHLGGESARTLEEMAISGPGRQLSLWRIRAGLLYYRKHHGLPTAWAVRQLESCWHRVRAWVNRHDSRGGENPKAAASLELVALLHRAWLETAGGRISPARPW